MRFRLLLHRLRLFCIVSGCVLLYSFVLGRSEVVKVKVVFGGVLRGLRLLEDVLFVFVVLGCF